MNSNAFRQINPFIGKYINQSNTRHLSWQKKFAGRMVSEIVTPMGASVPPLLSQAISQHAAATDHEDDCYLIIFKNDKTEIIAGLDSQRDSKYIGLKNMADALSRIGTAEQQQFALQLLDLIAHYKVDVSERYDDETTKMSQLLQVLQTSDWTARVTALGLTATVNELVSINQQMNSLINERNDELATISPQAMVQARAAADEAYALVVSIVNALAISTWADGSSPYDQAIDRINQDQVYYTQHVFNESSGSGSSGSSGNGGNGSNSGDSGNGGNSGSGSGDNGGDNGGGGSDWGNGSDE